MKDFLDSVSDAIGSMRDVLYREAESDAIKSLSSCIVSANRRLGTENPRSVTAHRPFAAATRHSHTGDLDVQCASDARVPRSLISWIRLAKTARLGASLESCHRERVNG